MGLRPGHCYSKLSKDRPYTRFAATVPDKNYIGTAPAMRIRQWNMGNPVKQYNRILNLIVESPVQIRDNAMESARLTVNRYLVNKVGKDNFFMKLRRYPHQVLRENKQAQGAGADRVSKGMSLSFGRPIGRAVRATPGKILMSVLVNAEDIEKARKALLRARARLPTKISVTVGTNVESIGTRPRLIKLKEIEEKTEAEEKAVAEQKEKEAAAKAPAKVTEKGKEKEKIEAAKKAEERTESAEGAAAPAAKGKK